MFEIFNRSTNYNIMNIQKLRYFLSKDDYAAFSTALTEELKTLVDDVN